MRQIRVRAENGVRFVEALRASGFDAEWLGAGSAPTTLHGGCADPAHCPQHPAARHPQGWGAIRTSASGNQAAKVFQEVLNAS